MNPLPLLLIIVTLPLLLGGCGKEELSPIPDTVTKEFIMDLWAQPNIETDVIGEIKHHMRESGVWKVTRRIHLKGEFLDSMKGTMVGKYVNRRYFVSKYTSDISDIYSAVTYDYDKEKYHSWAFGDVSGKVYFAEHSGRILDDKLIEWESVVLPVQDTKITNSELSKNTNSLTSSIDFLKEGLPLEDTKIKSRELSKNAESIKSRVEYLREGEDVMIAEEIATRVSQSKNLQLIKGSYSALYYEFGEDNQLPDRPSLLKNTFLSYGSNKQDADKLFRLTNPIRRNSSGNLQSFWQV